jgi:hypothetical protein
MYWKIDHNHYRYFFRPHALCLNGKPSENQVSQHAFNTIHQQKKSPTRMTMMMMMMMMMMTMRSVGPDFMVQEVEEDSRPRNCSSCHLVRNIRSFCS